MIIYHHWRLLASMAVGAMIAGLLTLLMPLAPSTCFIVGWDSAVLTYLASIISMVRRDTLHHHLSCVPEGKGVILTLVCVASMMCLLAITRQLQIGKDFTGVRQLLNLLLTVGTIFMAWLMIQVVFALQYAYMYHAALTDARQPNKAGTAQTSMPNLISKPLMFPEMTQNMDVAADITNANTSSNVNLNPNANNKTAGFADFFYCAVSIGTSGQTADVAFTSTAGRQLATLHSIIAFVFNLAIISLLINIIASYL